MTTQTEAMLAQSNADDLTLALFKARLRKADRCRELGRFEEAAVYECIAYDLYVRAN